MKKHTPGPWSMDGGKTPDMFTGRIDSIKGFICDLTADGRTGRMFRGEKEGIANAHLIVAAPNLLSALENCVASMEWHKAQGLLAGMDQKVIDEAKAAIARAEGRQP